MLNDVLTVCQQIRIARSNGEVRRLLDTLLCEKLGWDNYAYVAHFPLRFVKVTQALAITNYPVRWQLNYFRKGYYAVDPLVNHCQNHNLGIVWTTDPRDWVNFGNEAQEIVTMARKEGWMGGVAIPVPAIPCRGTFGLLTRKPLDSVQDMINTALLLGPAIGLHVHDALLEIALNKTFSAIDKRNLYLSDLEKDIMQWTADGMSGKQVADQLSISTKTVERHLEKVRERFNAPNRARLLVLAFALGLIQTGRAWKHGSVINADGYEDRLEKLFSGEVKLPHHLVHDYICGELTDDEIAR
jgi:LuxR family transcriptional regulator, quorum-sensing system regulator LasR